MKKQLLALALVIGMITTGSIFADRDSWRSAYWQDEDARFQSPENEGAVAQAALLAPRAGGNFANDLSEGKGVVKSSGNVVRNATGDAAETVDKALHLNFF